MAAWVYKSDLFDTPCMESGSPSDEYILSRASEMPVRYPVFCTPRDSFFLDVATPDLLELELELELLPEEVEEDEWVDMKEASSK